VQRLFRDQVPDADDDKDLFLVLSNLVSTSQVTWLEHHKKFQEFIFHAPLITLKICKDVLSHDHAQHVASPLVAVDKKDVERYSK